ncbi:MAG TPA: arylsulfatase, partial [Planctomycetaceae bacterium]|nr:arylsulfatase [Planctomycetaceae bacterium]
MLTDQAIWFIEHNKDRPFFLTVSHYAVHIPLEATPEAVEKFKKKPKPPTGVNNPVYAAMIENLDQSIARILEKLDELALTNRTVIVFTS